MTLNTTLLKVSPADFVVLMVYCSKTTEESNDLKKKLRDTIRKNPDYSDFMEKETFREQLNGMPSIIICELLKQIPVVGSVVSSIVSNGR